MIVRAQPRLVVAGFGHFQLWYCEVNQVRNFDGVSFAVMVVVRAANIAIHLHRGDAVLASHPIASSSL